MIHLDTTFLVDLLRERRRNRPGPASAHLDALPAAEVLGVSVHVVCELMAGAHAGGAPAGEAVRIGELLDALDVRYPDERFAAEYGRTLARIRASGGSIATMDLLIAVAALLDEAAIVTRNARHFAAVPGLRTRPY